MDTLYRWLTFLHVATVIVWLRGIFTLTILTTRSERGPGPRLSNANGLHLEVAK